MKIKEYIFMALRDLWRRKGRTILTSLGITIGTLLIVTMVGLGTGLNKLMDELFNSEDVAKSIYVNNLKYVSEEEEADIDYTTFYEDYYKKIDDDTIKEIKDTGKIESIKAYFTGSIEKIKLNNKEYKGYVGIKGYNTNESFYTDSEIESIRKNANDSSIKPIKEGRYLENKGEVLIGEEFLSSMNFSIDDVINKEIEVIIESSNGNPIEPIAKTFKVVGVIDKNFNDAYNFVFSAEDAASILEVSTMQKDYLKNVGYSSLEIITNELEDVQSVSDKIKDMDYLYSSAAEQAKSIDDTLSSLSAGFAVLGIIVLIVAAIGIINTMSMAVIERTKSIGVMKSVGADKIAVRTMFLVQSAIIGLLGSAVGILLASGVNAIIQASINNYIKGESMNISISVGLPWYLIVAVLGFSTIIALISGIYPANKASNLDPIEALRR
ncbi:MAG: ABC transporter permease [Clostridiales bacterium]|nr:ABC transporter permease [Clostridiales bacterium]